MTKRLQVILQDPEYREIQRMECFRKSCIAMPPFIVATRFNRRSQHFAVMREHHISQILTFDSGFDTLPGVTRIA